MQTSSYSENCLQSAGWNRWGHRQVQNSGLVLDTSLSLFENSELLEQVSENVTWTGFLVALECSSKRVARKKYLLEKTTKATTYGEKKVGPVGSNAVVFKNEYTEKKFNKVL